MNIKLYILIGVVIVLGFSIYFIDSNSTKRIDSSKIETITPRTNLESDKMTREKATKYELAKEITTPDGFINNDGKPITIKELIGKKVILIDFWTYSCINCQRTTPYLNSWYEKYKDKGLVIIGIHTPEFEFEEDYNNVKAAVEKFGIKFPVVLDNDYSTWTAYKNKYWPRKYLIDIDGYIVYDHIGEGAYEETEIKIQNALKERMSILGENKIINEATTKEINDQISPRSPEIYFGASRNEFFGNGKKGIVGIQSGLIIPNQINDDTLYLSGDWYMSEEFAQNNSINAAIVYKYTAKDVFFVSSANTEIIAEVLLDGKPVGAEAGEDIVRTSDGKTIVKIKEARLYNIINSDQLKTHTIKFIILNPGLKAFTFTFG